MIIEFKLYEQANDVVYRLGKETDLKDIKRITGQLRNELGFVMNVALIDAIKHDELIVAESDGVVIGFVHYHKRRDGWNTIHEIGVRKDFQSMGIGKELFEMVPKPRRLKTTKDNIKANDFYKMRGMDMIGTEKGRKRELNVWADMNESNKDIDPYGEEIWEDLPIEEHILVPRLEFERQDSFWYYNQTIAIFRKGEHEVKVFCVGDIGIRFEENGPKYDDQAAVDEALRRGWVDQDLVDCNTWINNNWFELEVDGEIDQDVAYLYDHVMEQAREIIIQL